MDIYVQANGQKRGPFSESQVREGIENGIIRWSDLGCTSSGTSWRPISELLGSDSGRKRHQGEDRTILWAILGIMVVLGILYLALHLYWANEMGATRRSLEEDYRKIRSSTSPNSSLYVLPEEPRASVPVVGQVPVSRYNGTNSASSEPIVFPTIPPLASSPIQAPTPVTEQQQAGLLKTEDVFVAVYGKPVGSILGSSPKFAGATVSCFLKDGLTYLVMFWRGVAQYVGVLRNDEERLTEADIQFALAAYADGGVWKLSPSAESTVSQQWERDGAVAKLIERPQAASKGEENAPADALQIATPEYWHQLENPDGPPVPDSR